MTRRALDLLNSKRNDAYEVALAALREYTQDWWAEVLESDPEELEEDEEPATPMLGPTTLSGRASGAMIQEPEEGADEPAADSRAGTRRGAGSRQAGAARPLRGSPRPQAGACARSAAAPQGPAAADGEQLIRLANEIAQSRTPLVWLGDPERLYRMLTLMARLHR